MIDKLIVKPIEETAKTFQQYYDFIQAAYAERVQQGIHFVCTSLSEEELKEEIASNGCQVYLGFIDERESEIASSISVAYKENRDEKYAWFHLVATNDCFKGKGIGTLMLKEMIEKAKKANCDYVSLSTGKKAISAVGFYIKNGFFIESDYFPLFEGQPSYTFHYQIKHPSRWDKISYRRYKYTTSKIKQIAKMLVYPFYRILKNK